MKLSSTRMIAAMSLAAMSALAAQEEPRPPRAEPVPEEDTAEPMPAGPPRAEVIPEDDAPIEESSPDEPWEDPDVIRERKAREKAEERKAKAAKEAEEEKAREAEERRKMEKEEAREVRAVPNDSKPVEKPAPREVRPEKPKIALALKTDPNAKPLSLRVPGPRGLIVARNGEPFAQNRLAHYIGIQLPMKEGLTDVQILDFARGPLAFCQAQLPEKWDVSDADIIQHYHKRRWVPLYSSVLLPDERAAKLKDAAPAGVILRPFFLRSYPENATAGHLMGQMGKSGAFAPPKQDLEAEELMWPPTVGRAGLEKRFDKELTGTAGLYQALFDANGDMLSEEWTSRPKAGNTVVTTLDMGFQKIAERKMREERVRGAFVILDVRTGDILAMVSTPSTNPNDWVYEVSKDFYNKTLKDPDNPMFCRAIQGLYPPASTFKVVTALAALETDEIGPNSYFPCPPVMYFNKQPMKNHTRRDEGSMDVERAIMRSCNTWFYKVSQICGGAALSTMGSRFGFGDKTGICLEDMEKAGVMPTSEYHKKKDGSSLTGGILANTAIGQGDVLSTPLQVAQMMAGIARGDAVPRPRLVKMIQDVDGRVVQYFPPSSRAPLGLEKENLAAVQRGMRQVVSGGGGTGSRAENHYVPIAGKTGTGEWKEDRKTGEKQYVAWFAGFIPYKNPEYAYACLYEGDPGDGISGGKKVAPIVGDVFNEIYRAKKKQGEIKDGDDEDEDGETVASRREVRRAKPVEEVRPAEPAPAPVAVEQPKRGGLRWLFGRRNKQPQPAPPPPADPR